MGCAVLGRQRAQRDAQGVHEQELVQRVHGCAFSGEVETHGIDWQLAELQPAQALYSNADHGGGVGG